MKNCKRRCLAGNEQKSVTTNSIFPRCGEFITGTEYNATTKVILLKDKIQPWFVPFWSFYKRAKLNLKHIVRENCNVEKKKKRKQKEKEKKKKEQWEKLLLAQLFRWLAEHSIDFSARQCPRRSFSADKTRQIFLYTRECISLLHVSRIIGDWKIVSYSEPDINDKDTLLTFLEYLSLWQSTFPNFFFLNHIIQSDSKYYTIQNFLFSSYFWNLHHYKN